MSEASNREENVPFAYEIASYLNVLIDKGILNSRDVSQATEDALFEFANKIDISTHGNDWRKFPRDPKEFPEDKIDKIRTLFSSNYLAGEGSPTEERVVDFARGFLKYLQDSGFRELNGMLLFGSRMNKDKKPRADSDLDVVLVIDKPSEIVAHEFRMMHEDSQVDPTEGDFHSGPFSSYSELDIWAWSFCNKFGYQDMREVPFAVSGILNKELLLMSLKLDTVGILPLWGYDPDSIYFVGKLEGMDEFDVNSVIQTALNSDSAKTLKQNMLEEIKKAMLLVGEK